MDNWERGLREKGKDGDWDARESCSSRVSQQGAGEARVHREAREVAELAAMHVESGARRRK